MEKEINIKELKEESKKLNLQIYENGKLDGYISAKTWHYVTDKLPLNPKKVKMVNSFYH